jgi:hypothetical protein
MTQSSIEVIQNQFWFMACHLSMALKKVFMDNWLISERGENW